MQLQKGTKESSSLAAKGTPTIRFGAKDVEPHGLTWFSLEKEAKYSPKNWIDEGRLALAFRTIHDKVREFGLLREFYENWDTSFGESNERLQGRVPRYATGVPDTMPRRVCAHEGLPGSSPARWRYVMQAHLYARRYVMQAIYARDDMPRQGV
ncbi:hypothetical protein HAX54_037130 [Datura stramonium]|uniref:Uncharacterized protein n=1 Tax=Datura stramonium TaxID=4076 RepID=A0ABS8VJ40_DATST|nr:hypothetical protein [Datura stramonium]